MSFDLIFVSGRHVQAFLAYVLMGCLHDCLFSQQVECLVVWNDFTIHHNGHVAHNVYMSGHSILLYLNSTVPRPPYAPCDGPIEHIFNRIERLLQIRMYQIRNIEMLQWRISNIIGSITSSSFHFDLMAYIHFNEVCNSIFNVTHTFCIFEVIQIKAIRYLHPRVDFFVNPYMFPFIPGKKRVGRGKHSRRDYYEAIAPMPRNAKLAMTCILYD